MITIDEIADRIRAEMRGKAKRDVQLGPDSVLEELGLSSLQIADVIYGIQEDYDLTLDEQRAADTKTVGQLADLVNETLGERPDTATAPA